MVEEPRPSQPPQVTLPAPAPIPTFDIPDESGRPPALPPGVATQEKQPGSEQGWTLAWFVGLAAAALVAAGLWAWRWRVRTKRQEANSHVRIPTGPMPPPKPAAPGDAAKFWTPAAARPAPAAAPETAPAAPPPSRPRLSVALTPHRAGLNLLSALVEVEVEVRNEGESVASDVRVSLHLLGASAGQDDALGDIFAAAPASPATPPFVLPPGERCAVRATLSVSRAAIVPLAAGDRQIYVPVVAVDVRYGLPDRGQGQTAAAYMIGATRPDSDKLAPFWLDAAPRTLDDVAARPHALSISS